MIARVCEPACAVGSSPLTLRRHPTRLALTHCSVNIISDDAERLITSSNLVAGGHSGKAIRGPPATLQSDRDLSTRTHSLKPPTTPRISFRLLWNATHVRSLRRRRVEKPQYGPTMQTAYAKSASDNQVRIPSVRIITDASLERPPGRAPGIGEPPALACSQGLPGPSPED